MADEIMSLAHDAPAVTDADWLAAVDKVLKGKDFDAVLRSRVADGADGIVIEPLYTSAGAAIVPDYPDRTARRGATVSGLTGGWDVRQRHDITTPSAANSAILEDLARGVGSIELHGQDVVEPSLLAAILDGVMVDMATVALTGADAATARNLLEFAASAGVAKGAVQADLGCDPVGRVVSSGGNSDVVATEMAAASELAAEVATAYPNVSTMTADSAGFAHGGAAATTELAVLASTGVAYLRALTDGGLGIDDALGQILLRVTVGTDQFTDIAKLRALRVIWSRIANASGAQRVHPRIQAVTSSVVLTKYDPWVNMLRATISTFAAAAGGAEIITARCFDEAVGIPDELGRRIARNTQVVLMEESNIHRVIDPAGGSWYVEALTDKIAQSAWTQFQELEKVGGIVSGLIDGSVADRIGSTWTEQARAVATRRRAITGVSEFPDIEEQPLQRAERRPRIDGSVAGDIAAIPERRIAGEYERLRSIAGAQPQRPKVFLANLGEAGVHTARSTWAKNFFEAGGIGSISNEGFDDAGELAAAFAASGASIAVLCSSDAEYERSAVGAAGALRSAGAVQLYLAGHPGELRGALVEAGVGEFIHVGCDVLATLEGALEILGVDLEVGA